MKEWWKNFFPSGLSRGKGGREGFSLLEVAIAATIFTIFILSYHISQGQNIDDSTRLQEELVLRRLAEDIMNQIILNAPEFPSSYAGMPPRTERFEDEYEDYEYTVEYRKVEIPDFSQFKVGGEDAPANKGIQDVIYKQVKENVEKMIWQVGITVNRVGSKDTFIISTWIRDWGVRVTISL